RYTPAAPGAAAPTAARARVMAEGGERQLAAGRIAGGRGMGGGGGGFGLRGAENGTVPNFTSDLDLSGANVPQKSVQAAAQGGEVGELFQYDMETPVSLARLRSAMLPIINDSVEGKKVSIYNSQVDPKHPLNGIELKNSSKLHLMQGPVTVFDGGVYAGD